jgi:hypothetical protein
VHTYQEQQAIVTTASLQIHAFIKHHAGYQPLLLSNGQNRGNMFAGPLRKFRPQPIYARPDGNLGLRADLRGVTPHMQLTNKMNEKDEDEEAIQQTKTKIRDLKILDVNSTRRTLRIADEALEVGLGTLRML